MVGNVKDAGDAQIVIAKPRGQARAADGMPTTQFVTPATNKGTRVLHAPVVEELIVILPREK